MPGSLRPRSRGTLRLGAALLGAAGVLSLPVAVLPAGAQAADPVDGIRVDSIQPYMCDLQTYSRTGSKTGTLGKTSASVRLQFVSPLTAPRGTATPPELTDARLTATFPAGTAGRLGLAAGFTLDLGAELQGERSGERLSYLDDGAQAPAPTQVAADGSVALQTPSPPFTATFGFVGEAGVQGDLRLHPGAVQAVFARPGAAPGEVAPVIGQCVPSSPTALLATIVAADAPAVPERIVELGARSGSTLGGTSVPIYLTPGRLRVTRVTFDGVDASFEATGPGRIIAVAPPHAAAENVRIAVVAGALTPDTAQDDFDYLAPVLARGGFATSAPSACTAWTLAGARYDAGTYALDLTLRGELPASAQTGGLVAPVRVRPSFVSDPDGAPVAEPWLAALPGAPRDVQLTDLTLATTGTAQPSLALLRSPVSGPALLSNSLFTPLAWDVPLAGPLPSVPGATVTAPIGGRVGFAVASFRLRARFVPNAWDEYPLELRCSPRAGNVAIGGVAVTPSSLPVVSRVFGSGRAGVGGVALIQGSRFTRVKAVRFGNRAATFVRVSGSTVILASAPAQAAGTYAVRVTTQTGTSVAATAGRYVYR